MSNERAVLVLGATGGVGGEIARQMRDAGWEVRAMRRGEPGSGERRDGIRWVRGDALDREDVSAAARGATVIVHAVNPPGYRNWAELVVPMMDNTISAGAGVGATVVLPGTIYNYGPDAFPVLREDSPQHPVTRKGALRVEMEQRLRAYAARGGRALIVRAGDFFGPTAVSNSWFAQGLVKAGQSVRTIYRPGAPGVGHEWCYLPDVARTVVELLEKGPALEPFARFHMAGHWDPDGTRMTDAIRRVVARRTGVEPRVSDFPWWLLRLAAPFVTTFREMREMRYLWRKSLCMENARLEAMLGREPHTPWDVAVETTLEGLGCLPAAGANPGVGSRCRANERQRQQVSRNGSESTMRRAAR
jgi:nucleoside-diphosphate-sugar epimerase